MFHSVNTLMFHHPTAICTV